MVRILIFGNSGSGKSTMARDLSLKCGIPHLDLDQLAWTSPGTRKPVAESAAEIRTFAAQHPQWVAEGCYADLVEVLVPLATELRFLNPGVEACIANCRARPWEPDKYASKEEQDARLEFLLQWVRDYETRHDEYSLTRHRELFDRYAGPKREWTQLQSS
jgi:adenylate kinase family enzyme